MVELSTCYQEFARGLGPGFHVARALFRAFPRFGGTLFVVARLQPSWHP